MRDLRRVPRPRTKLGGPPARTGDRRSQSGPPAILKGGLMPPEFSRAWQGPYSLQMSSSEAELVEYLALFNALVS